MNKLTKIRKESGDAWVYESPDNGETIYKRPFMDYNPENKIKLTKEQWKLEKEK